MNADAYQTCVSLLKNKIFLGHYSGRHRVDEIDEFRDVINLHSTEEELKNDIDSVLTTVYNSRASVWVALSDSSGNNAYSLWVQLDGIAFGHYWFQIKHVRLTGRELFCVVSVLRSVPAQLVNPSFSFSQGFESAMQALRGVGVGSGRASSVSSDRNEGNRPREETSQRREEETNTPRGRNNTDNTNRQENHRPESSPVGHARPFSFLKDLRGVTFDQIKASFSNEELGFGLVKTLLICFFFTVIGAMNLMYESLVIFTNIVVVTGDVTIRGIHAVSRLVESLSPIFLGVLNFVGKLVTGLYILVAMLFGCTPYMPNQQKPSPPRRPAVMYR